ncbi:MAG: hypothetical protein ABJH68_18605 [Ilumatobacter sp.]|uniref:hypothetical protein n=1 Tax=Ilumatobacter sp. TaxID=1967498 RepID=UPI0032972C9B
MTTHRPSRRVTFASCALLASSMLIGCATTNLDDTSDPADSLTEAELTGGEGRQIAEDDTSPLEEGEIVDPDAPTTTLAIVGSPADLLPEIGIDMSRLSAEIGDDGDEDATIARIEANWAAIEDEVAESNPELVNSIQATVDMARTAVDANRPADADKAFGLLTDLIDAYTGDG